MVPLITLLLAVLSPSLTRGQSSKLQWAPEEIYNPTTEPRKCGLPTDEPAYVCDPNGILGEHLNSFNWILKDAAFNSTKCPCSTYNCEHWKEALGYRIGLAIVRKMKLQKGSDGRRNTLQDQAQLFAHRLGSEQWNMGRCEENIIILYSVDDQTLALYGGSTALLKLTPYYRKLLIYRVSSRFEEGKIVEALNNLIYDIKVVLNCDNDQPDIDCGLHEMRGGAGTIIASMATVFAAILLSMHNFVF